MKLSKKGFSFIGIILLGFILTSCDCIQGEGPLVKESRDVSDFNGVILDISANVFIEKSDTWSVTIEAQENIIGMIETINISGKLKIKQEQCIISSEPVTIHIMLPELTELTVNGSGDIESLNTLSSDDLDLNIYGSGDIDLDIMTKRLEAGIYGSGTINIEGNAGYGRVKINGSGDFEARDLIMQRTKITVNGSGDCTVFVEDELDITVNGSGSIIYYGSPDISTKIHGSGQVSKGGE